MDLWYVGFSRAWGPGQGPVLLCFIGSTIPIKGDFWLDWPTGNSSLGWKESLDIHSPGFHAVCGLTVECSFCHKAPTQIPFLGAGTHFRLGVNDSSPLLLVLRHRNPVVSLNPSHIFISFHSWTLLCHLFPVRTLIHMVIIIIKFAYLVGANFFSQF